MSVCCFLVSFCVVVVFFNVVVCLFACMFCCLFIVFFWGGGCQNGVNYIFNSLNDETKEKCCLSHA